jgi:hypothetical protein
MVGSVQRARRTTLGLDDAMAAQAPPKATSWEAPLEAAGPASKVTPSRLREIEAKALRKLRHPGKSSMVRDFLDSVSDKVAGAPAQALSADDLLVSLSGMLEPDGGMPGKKDELRIANSLAALLFFYEHGNRLNSGTFRMHVDKLIQFLTPQRLQKLGNKQLDAAVRMLQLIGLGRSITGSWEEFVRPIIQGKRLDLEDFWAKVESALTPVESETAARE